MGRSTTNSGPTATWAVFSAMTKPISRQTTSHFSKTALMAGTFSGATTNNIRSWDSESITS